ncbi:hypothetical protein X737_33155 [Mesorhizobium sp. L48C026A00]|nr:hypothetical protein X737_33155 [Mesorhizobium sp. L48C026A00]
MAGRIGFADQAVVNRGRFAFFPAKATSGCFLTSKHRSRSSTCGPKIDLNG